MKEVEAFVDYVKSLEERLEKLEKLLFKTQLERTFDGTVFDVKMLPFN